MLIDLDLDDVERVVVVFLPLVLELDLDLPVSVGGLSSDLLDLVERLSVGIFCFKPRRRPRAKEWLLARSSGGERFEQLVQRQARLGQIN